MDLNSLEDARNVHIHKSDLEVQLTVLSNVSHY
jgi:hypothetical protein